MVSGLNRSARVRRWLAPAVAAACLAALAFVAPRLALLGAVLLSVWWVARRDNGVGTWGVLYVLLLIIAAVLALLVAGLALIHRLLGG